MVKNLPANAGDAVDPLQSMGWEDPLEKEMATHFRILAWELPWTKEPGQLLSMGSQRDTTEHTHTHTHTHPRQEAADHVFKNHYISCLSHIYSKAVLFICAFTFVILKEGEGSVKKERLESSGSPTFLAPRTSFVVNNFSTDQG